MERINSVIHRVINGVSAAKLLDGNYLVLNSIQFSNFVKKFPFWDTFYAIEDVRDEFDDLGRYVTTVFVLRKKLKYLDLNQW